jgi:hypothetical protein
MTGLLLEVEAVGAGAGGLGTLILPFLGRETLISADELE